MTRILPICLLGLSLAIAAATPAAAHAQGVQGEVLIILAKEQPGAVDEALSSIPALQRPPFNVFQSMRVLSRPTVRLRTGQAQHVDLPNGRRLRLVLEQITPDGRFRISVSINRPNQTDYLPLLQVVASPGNPFFVAGQSHDGGTLVIGVRIGQRPAPP